ncbi:hypothetical protein CAPTEDRAFT_187040 [Capitella teleta]|uniref:Uncharacterized protein n=1 Tax=Capitella teleta TaxID=283909 RepID=R7UXT8_CAPTE|nr:hypothetical protein CAPTEDRAFT_187040 [Capitella teleta]|eukprot:ELU11092.1 hypothetical protein CAPTEDRAFT_187040 [Capitella teleta]
MGNESSFIFRLPKCPQKTSCVKLLAMTRGDETAADCGSAHNPVIAKFKLKLKKLREAKPSKKLDLGLFKTVPNVKEDFVLEVNNRFQVLAEANTTDIETEWIYVEALERAKQHSLGI